MHVFYANSFRLLHEGELFVYIFSQTFSCHFKLFLLTIANHFVFLFCFMISVSHTMVRACVHIAIMHKSMQVHYLMHTQTNLGITELYHNAHRPPSPWSQDNHVKQPSFWLFWLNSQKFSYVNYICHIYENVS